jgi:hypothetical protein
VNVQNRPRVQAAHSVDELDAIDLEAITLAREWGVEGEILLVPVRPCLWADCGGSVMSFGGDRRCILCYRPPG